MKAILSNKLSMLNSKKLARVAGRSVAGKQIPDQHFRSV